MLRPNTTGVEERLDDQFLEQLDPYAMSKWDKEEGEEELQKVTEELQRRISSRHPKSLRHSSITGSVAPNFGVDDHLTDQKQLDKENLWDQALWDTCQLLRESMDIFARTPKSPGQTDSIEHEIVTEGELPKPSPMYRRSQPDQQLIKVWIDWMLANGLIEPSVSKCAQAILIVKKDGKEPRICLDPRGINRVTAADPYPMPRMDAIFAGLYGSEVFSSLDAASGFWQIPIAKHHRHKAAFRCEFGVFQFTVMPFGLNNAPATFMRWMDATFEGLNYFLKVYIDDLLVHSSKVAEHPEHLRRVFERCRSQNVKLRLSKCSFMRDELPMLGFIINTQGVRKDMNKVDAILQFGENRPEGQLSPFKNTTQLQSFLGMVNFYKHHHHKLAEELNVLYDLLKKEKNPRKDWTLKCEQAFQRVKEMIAEQSLLYYPDLNLPFEIHSDASKYAIAAVLMQMREGILHTIEFFSRSLKPPELNYTVTDKEFLAIISAIERWHHFLHKPFLVVTDHKPLLGLTNTDRPRLKRWMLRITPYKFDIMHRAGEEMIAVDPLSRDPRLLRIAMEEEEETKLTEAESIFQQYQALYQPQRAGGTTPTPQEVKTLKEAHREAFFEGCERLFVSQTMEIYVSRSILEEVCILSANPVFTPFETNVYRTEIISDTGSDWLEEEEERLTPVTTQLTLRVLAEVQPVEQQVSLRFSSESYEETTAAQDCFVYDTETQELQAEEKIPQPEAKHAAVLQQAPSLLNGDLSLDSKYEEEKMMNEEKEEASEKTYLQSLLEALKDVDPAVLYPGSKTFADEQKEDPVLSPIISKLAEIKGECDGYFLEKGTNLLLKRSEDGSCPRVVVPEQAENTLLYLYHDHPLAGHAKAGKMYKLMKRKYYFPSMKKKIEQWVEHCKCKRASATMHRKAGYTLSRPIPGIFEWLVMDIVGPFPNSKSQNKYWLTLMDAFSKDLELVAIRSREAEAVAKAILERWVCRRGCPKVLLSDNAQEFIGKVISHLCKALAVRQESIVPYHHRSAGLVERVHRYAESIQQALIEDHTSYGNWDTLLIFMQFAITTHDVDDSGLTPFELKHGFSATMPGDLLHSSINIPSKLRKYYEKAQQAMKATRDYFLIQRRKRRIQVALNRNEQQRRTRVFYEPGQPVFVTKPSFTRKEGLVGLRKLQGSERGPYKVTRRDNFNNIWVNIEGVETKFNIEQVSPAPSLRPVKREPPQYKDGSLDYFPPIPEVEVEEEPEEAPSVSPLPSDENKEEHIQSEQQSNPQLEGTIANLAGGRESSSSSNRKQTPQSFYLVRDTVIGENYAAKLMPPDDEEQSLMQLHLYAKAKKGTYHPIWYDPADFDADPPTSKASLQRPKGWEPWVITIGDGWEMLQGPFQKVQQIKHNLIPNATEKKE